MNGRAQLTKNRELLLDASTGLLSGFIYLSYVLSFAFLIPVQYAFAGRGKKSGLVAATFSFLAIAVGQIARMLEIKAVDPLVILAGVLPPLLLLAAIWFVNARIGKLEAGGKILIAALILSAVAAPLVMKATSDKSFSAWLIEYIGSAMKSSGLEGDGAAYARAAVNSAIAVIQSAFAAMILWVLAGSWWLGSFIAARSAVRQKKADESVFASISLSRLRVPSIALWPTLLSWALLFAALLTKQTGLVSALVWNIALCSASLYAMQGIGIISHLSRQFNATRILRLLTPLAIMAIALSSTAGAIIMITLPVLGITEVWLPYRNLKGALK
ncbi:MAG TPA: hypothetical protein VN445_03645 [Rectinemataceae bacterium]|nr:hypothetical protein [Rectinemataceae bacterium]